MPASQEVIQYLKDTAVKKVVRHSHSRKCAEEDSEERKTQEDEEATNEETMECPVCTDDMLDGEDIVCLPHCKHHFHLPW